MKFCVKVVMNIPLSANNVSQKIRIDKADLGDTAYSFDYNRH